MAEHDQDGPEAGPADGGGETASARPRTVKHPLRVRFDQAERAVGPHVERIVHADLTNTLLMESARVVRLGFRGLDAARSTVVHALGMTARGDVHRVSRQVAVLQAGIDELAQRIDEIDAERRP